MDQLDLLLHPVRLRIVHAMSGGHELTTAELRVRLPDVAKTSVYRHVGLLAEAGVLEVAGQRRVRGAVERRFRLRRERAMVEPQAGASMSLEDHRRGFAAAMAALHAEFNAYLDQDDADPFADSVGYRQGILWLSPTEVTEMIADVRAVLAARWPHQPTPGRRPHLVSMIMFPIQEPPPDETNQHVS